MQLVELLIDLSFGQCSWPERTEDRSAQLGQSVVRVVFEPEVF